MLANLKNKILQSTAYEKFKAVLSLSFHYLHKKFLWGLLSNIDEKFLKFALVGVLNATFAYVVYALLVAIGFAANIALFLEYIVGVLWNFKTTGTIVFKNKDNRLILKFIICYVATFVLNSVLLAILIKYMNEYLAQAILLPLVSILTFLLLKHFVFKLR